MTLERDVERAVIALYRSMGCEVWTLSWKTRGRAVTTQAGIPDLWVMRIGKGGWWQEVKTPGGRQSREQDAFMQQCARAGVPYVLGGVDAAAAHLQAIGVILGGLGMRTAVGCLLLMVATRLAAQDTTREHRMTAADLNHIVPLCADPTATAGCRDAAGNMWSPNPPTKHQYGPYVIGHRAHGRELLYVWRDGMACLWLEGADSWTAGIVTGIGCAVVDAPKP